MKLTSKEAKELLEIESKTTKDDRWIEHCISVGDSAGRIARALYEKGIDVDVDKAITLGYLHDIGKYNGESRGHVMRGYEYLKSKGYDLEFANICLTHSYLNNDVTCTAGGGPKPEDNPFLTDLMCPHGYNVFTIDKRLIDLIIRKGAYANTQYHVIETYKLKKYFDDLLGYNLYDLFPEIKDNL